MHEFSLMQDMVKAIEERVVNLERKSVRRVVLEVGQVSGVMPEALRFSFDVVMAESGWPDARLDIVEIPGLAECCSCGRRLNLASLYGLCDCGCSELRWLQGNELQIKNLEVA